VDGEFGSKVNGDAERGVVVPVAGVGSLIVENILEDASYALVEPIVNTAVPAGGIPVGVQTVAVYDPSMYVGAQILVGVLGGDLEVVVISAVVVGTSFTATFTNVHIAGEPIVGATFPVQNTAGDPFFTQQEMLTNLSTAVNDLLVKVPLVYAIGSLTMPPSQPFTALPSDCQFPVRVVPDYGGTYGNGLRETSQSWLDSTDYRWDIQAASEPQVFYRDKIGLQNVGIWPVANNSTPLQVVYAQSSAKLLGLADGFLVPDPFLVTVKCRVLEICYSKDGEQRSPALAKYYAQRFEMGCKIAQMIMQVIEDTSQQ
jgi:hypothetical protein